MWCPWMIFEVKITFVYQIEFFNLCIKLYFRHTNQKVTMISHRLNNSNILPNLLKSKTVPVPFYAQFTLSSKFALFGVVCVCVDVHFRCNVQPKCANRHRTEIKWMLLSLYLVCKRKKRNCSTYWAFDVGLYAFLFLARGNGRNSFRW